MTRGIADKLILNSKFAFCRHPTELDLSIIPPHCIAYSLSKLTPKSKPSRVCSLAGPARPNIITRVYDIFQLNGPTETPKHSLTFISHNQSNAARTHPGPATLTVQSTNENSLGNISHLGCLIVVVQYLIVRLRHPLHRLSIPSPPLAPLELDRGTFANK